MNCGFGLRCEVPEVCAVVFRGILLLVTEDEEEMVIYKEWGKIEERRD